MAPSNERPTSSRADAEPVALPWWKRRWLWLAVAAACVGLVAVGAGWYWGRGWLERRNLEKAQVAIEQEEYRRALLFLQQAVQVNPGSVSGWRALAEFNQRFSPTDAVASWRVLASLVPDDDTVWLGLAQNLIRQKQAKAAAEALERVTTVGRTGREYLRLHTAVAVLAGDTAEVRRRYEALAAAAAGDPAVQLMVASLALQDADAASVASAREQLLREVRGGSLRIKAGLALLRELPVPEPPEALRSLADQMVPRRGQTPPFAAILDYLKDQPNPAPDDAAALANWMTAHGRAREALVWLSTIPITSQVGGEVLAARTNAALNLRDWPLLQRLLNDGAWGRVNADAIALAFAARIQKERLTTAKAKATFGDAIEVGSASLLTLRALERLASIWGWGEESERVLLQGSLRFPNEEGPWSGLLARAEATRDAAKFADVARRRAQAVPADRAVRGMRVYSALLAGSADSAAKTAARDWATDATAVPEESAAAALFLRSDGKVAEAKAVLERHGDILATKPRPAFLLGVLLAQGGDKLSAEKWLGKLPPSRRLAPEVAMLSATETPSR